MPPIKNLIGSKFHRWEVLNFSKSKGRSSWWCQCDCGTVREVSASNLTTGKSMSCGCLNKEKTVRHGMTGTSEYTTWEGIKQRCCNPKCSTYEYYGGRGITMYEDWQRDFRNFYRDVGSKPSPKHSLDRVNNDGNYEPKNVRWVLLDVQHKNRRPKPTSFQVLQLDQEILKLKAKLTKYQEKFGDL